VPTSPTPVSAAPISPGPISRSGITYAAAIPFVGASGSWLPIVVPFDPVVNLKDANLSGANLKGANLNGVTSGGITGTPAALPSGWRLVKGYLVHK
jgi:hypothetical protein